MTCFLKYYIISCFYFLRVLFVITNPPSLWLLDFSPKHTSFQKNWHDHKKFWRSHQIPHPHGSGGMMPCWYFPVFSTEISYWHQCVVPRQKLVVVNNNMTSLDVTQPSSNVPLSVLDLSLYPVSNSALTIDSPIIDYRKDPFASLILYKNSNPLTNEIVSLS